MDIEISTITSISYSESIIDIHNGLHHYYLLKDTMEVEIYTYDNNLFQTLTLQKKGKSPLHIYADNVTLMIGFEDGTMELYQITYDHKYLRITSDRDAAGPGSKKIMQIAASPDFVLVQAYENGLLIYSKPSLMFYKWIMLGGHCEIRQFSMKYHILYVLVDRPEHEIHMLDFEKHRIFEQEVLAYNYVDIEFDGLYLYAATTTSVQVYLQEEAKRPMKQQKVAQINFSEKIQHLFRFQDELFVVFKNKIVELSLDVQEIDAPRISKGRTIDLETTGFASQLKYDYFSSQPHDTFVIPRTIIFKHDDQLKSARLSKYE